MVMNGTDEGFMQAALEEARRAEAEGEIPVGAVVVFEGEIIGRGGNRNICQSDPTAHAEILALRDAARRIANYRLEGCVLYVTLEPCVMCAGAALQARLSRLVYGCDDPKSGAVRSLFCVADDGRLNHKIHISGGILENECVSQITTFFRRKREQH